MYDLPLNATMNDVIQRSYTCHPSLFSDAMLDAARTHSSASQTMGNRTSSRIALEMECNLRRMADEISMDDLFPAGLTTGERVQAFTIAARLQCLPPSQVQEIAKRPIPAL